MFYASPLSVSLSFTFLKLFLYTPSAIRILYLLVRVLYLVRSPKSTFYADRRGDCYPPVIRPGRKAEMNYSREICIILDIIRKPNSIIVLSII